MATKKKKNKKIHRLLVKFVALALTFAVRLWMRTIRCKAVYYDPTVDPVHEDCQGQKIYIFWHENLLLPIYLRGHCNLAMLISQHRDADVLSHCAYHLGFDLVRGSTYRGGSSAIRELLRKSRQMHLTITPDGPRGPRRTLAQGAIYLSSRLGMPLVVLGVGYDKPWRAKSWDRFAVPRPFSRCRAVVGPAITLPADLDRDGIEHYRQQIETLLNRLTMEAEAWAEAGTSKVGEVCVRPQTAPIATRQEAEMQIHPLEASSASDEPMPGDDRRRMAG